MPGVRHHLQGPQADVQQVFLRVVAVRGRALLLGTGQPGAEGGRGRGALGRGRHVGVVTQHLAVYTSSTGVSVQDRWVYTRHVGACTMDVHVPIHTSTRRKTSAVVVTDVGELGSCWGCREDVSRVVMLRGCREDVSRVVMLRGCREDVSRVVMLRGCREDVSRVVMLRGCREDVSRVVMLRVVAVSQAQVGYQLTFFCQSCSHGAQLPVSLTQDLKVRTLCCVVS